MSEFARVALLRFLLWPLTIISRSFFRACPENPMDVSQGQRAVKQPEEGQIRLEALREVHVKG